MRVLSFRGSVCLDVLSAEELRGVRAQLSRVTGGLLASLIAGADPPKWLRGSQRPVEVRLPSCYRNVAARQPPIRRIAIDVDPQTTGPTARHRPGQEAVMGKAIPTQHPAVSIPQRSPTSTVAVGRYILEVGAPPGTSIFPAGAATGRGSPAAGPRAQAGRRRP